jgi:hypothetical protein
MGLNEGFNVINDSIKGSIGAIIFWICIIVIVYLALKYKVIK